MADTYASLETEYCPPVDAALLSAILSDYDLSDRASVADARLTLDAIKLSAEAEDASLFDPSGSANFGEDGAGALSDDTASRSKTPHERSVTTSVTSLSNGLSSLELDHDSNPGKAAVEEYDSLDEATKMQSLREMFPGRTEFAVSHTLKKCNGKWSRALEELLNQEFFDGGEFADGDGRIFAKGVDAFSEEQLSRRGRQKRSKKNRKLLESEAMRSSSLPAQQVAAPSPWEIGKRDIGIVSALTDKSPQYITSLYHQNGASIPRAIAAMAELEPPQPTLALDPVIQANAFELGRDFPTIPPKLLAGLIRITHPSTAKAHELAKIYAAPRPTASASGESALTPSYTRFVPEAEDAEPNSLAASNYPATVSKLSAATTLPDASHRATTYAAASQRAFASASAAHRRGKSDRLMSSAAGYYSQVGRDMAARRDGATAEAADALVAAQSTPAALDLHGVSVRDAVRIARARTEAWWRAGGGRGTRGLDGRMVRDAAADAPGLSIITGVGRHSQGGRAKIGPAVGKMLVSEGWMFGVDEGVFTVTGKR